jgi:hypothetical protein
MGLCIEARSCRLQAARSRCTIGAISWAENASAGGDEVGSDFRAEPRRLVRRTVVQQLQPVALGLLLGLTGVYWMSRLLERFLFGVSPLDPWAYVAAPALLLVVACAGCLIPARRILRVDVLAALRAE